MSMSHGLNLWSVPYAVSLMHGPSLRRLVFARLADVGKTTRSRSLDDLSRSC